MPAGVLSLLSAGDGVAPCVDAIVPHLPLKSVQQAYMVATSRVVTAGVIIALSWPRPMSALAMRMLIV